MEHLRIGSLLKTQDGESVGLLVSQVLEEIHLFYFIDGQPFLTRDSDSLKFVQFGDLGLVDHQTGSVENLTGSGESSQVRDFINKRSTHDHLITLSASVESLLVVSVKLKARG